ncbi:MAG TPA: toll/interleukin-1 receptor domain-containing protein, partial [Isosphaeraceae bacterium]|nr:toll/interleukin-1 receptor domain-containing protein [Isosphaeraceae bacterium]
MAVAGQRPPQVFSGYDVFLSYGTPDRPWVRGLRDELEKLDLTVFLDERDLEPGDNWVLGLSGAMLHSRSMALVLSAETLHRKWVEPEWTSFLAAHGATSGRLVPVLIDEVTLPPYLNAIQAINARDLDTARVARALAGLVGRRGELAEGDVRRLYFGQHLVFVLEPAGDGVGITDSTGRPPRTLPAPWRGDTRFTVARIEFARLTREPVGDDRSRAELHGHAATLGGLLFDLLFDARALDLLREATIPGQPRPLVTIRSDDDLVLSLPWELLHHDGRFLVRDGDLDLARSIPRPVGPGAFLQAPARRFALVVNVSAPEGSGLDYEGESYRLTRALTDHCELTPTELGTLDDLVRTVADKKPAGIHFSGHGGPGMLSFEDDEGRERPVAVGELVGELKKNDPEGLLPPFFYLASCHGNDPAALQKGRPGVESLAARLHRE